MYTVKNLNKIVLIYRFYVKGDNAIQLKTFSRDCCIKTLHDKTAVSCIQM